MPAPVVEDEDLMLTRAIAMSLEEHPRVEEEDKIISDQQPGELSIMSEIICIGIF